MPSLDQIKLTMKKYFYTFLLSCFFLNSALADISKKERSALIDLYTATNGSHWTKKWNMDEPVSQWFGVKVIDDKVVEINLFRNNLQGPLPESIEKLENLQALEP